MKAKRTAFDDVLAQLKTWGNESYLKMNAQHDAGDNPFGVLLGNRPMLQNGSPQN
jgi:hypothetical protein